MADGPLNVLFLCTGNSARSIMAEAIMNRVDGGKFKAYSAGSMPKGEVHPRTLEILKRNAFRPENFRSKGWEEFSGPTRRSWILYSPSATTPPTRSARSGRASR
jgi:protein-tyrosine-phosphatase